MNAWLVTAMAALTALGGGSGLIALLTVRSARQKITAEADSTVAGAVKVLIGGATDLVAPLQRALDLAEARADSLNAKLAQAHGEVAQLRTELREAREENQRWRRAVADPGMTLDRLRRTLPAQRDRNGSGT